MSTLSFFVPGIPAPQGSKVRTKWGGMREDNENTQPWREAVIWAAKAARTESRQPIAGPVDLQIDFRFPRLTGHLRANGEVKPTAPHYKVSIPDIDKLARAVCDALTGAGVWRDDSVVAILSCQKVYADVPGAYIVVNDLNERSA